MFRFFDHSARHTFVDHFKPPHHHPKSSKADTNATAAMVKQSDRAPLLDWEEIPPPDPKQGAPPPPSTPRKDDAPPQKSSQANGLRAATVSAFGSGWSSGTSAITCSQPTRSVTAVVARGDGSSGRPQTVVVGQHFVPDPSVPFFMVKDQWEEKDQIVAVFVVTFDTRSGRQSHWTEFFSN